MTDKRGRRDESAAASEEVEESPDPLEFSRRRLRQRWELASVLNFLSVFEPVIGKDLKMSAEEIEMALINPNASLAKLHVTLLKGIPPVSKNLSNPDVWVTILCKKLAEWWPWVAEGDIPLTAAKGEEIPKYKELDPTIRLRMLKALCELRAEQDDLLSYINDGLKEGKQPNEFRKDKICADGSGLSYWYDGNSVIGHRLYKEVNRSLLKPKHKGKGCLDPPNNIEWETLATNLDEFRNILEQMSSCKVGVEAAVCKTIETEVIPVLEQLQKKKERALKRQQRQDAVLNGYQSLAIGVTRSCRARRPVSYTFDEYDRAIDEALKSTRKRKDRAVQRHDTKQQQQQRKRGNVSCDGDSEKDALAEEGSPASTDNEEAEDDDRQVDEGSDKEDDTKNSDSSGENDSEKNESGKDNSESESSEFDHENAKPKDKNDEARSSGASGCSSSENDRRESRNVGAKNHLRQRPTRNTAIESVTSDSDNGSASENASSGASGGSGEDEDPAVVSDSEDEVDS